MTAARITPNKGKAIAATASRPATVMRKASGPRGQSNANPMRASAPPCVAIKPTSSLSRPQKTVTRSGEPAEIATRGRHDPCLLPRFVPMGEAMLALVLVDHWLRWRAQCSNP